MLWNLLRQESRKLFRSRLLPTGLGVLVLVIAVEYSLFFAFRANMGGLRPYLVWPGVLVYALNLASGFQTYTSYGTYLLIVLVGLGAAREYSWRTLHLWLGQGAPRALVLAAKLLLAVVQAALVVMACLLTVGGLGAIFAVASGGSAALDWSQVATLAASAGRAVYSMLPYAALTVLLAVLTRSVWGAIGGGLAFLAVVESSLLNLLPALGPGFARAVQYLPAGLAQALDGQDAALAHQAVAHTPVQPDPLVAAAAIAGYTLVFAGAAILAFRRQDLT